MNFKYEKDNFPFDEQLKEPGKKGIVGHSQVSDVFKLSDHGDPAKGFPWDFFIQRVEHHYQERNN